MKSALKTLIAFFFVFNASLFIVAILIPPIFSFIEKSTNTPLPYEGALRLFFTSVWLCILLLSLHWVLRKGDRRHWLIISLLGGALIPLAAVFFLDSSHRLLEEYSWIRYITAGSLFFAFLTSIILALFYAREGRAKRSLAILWLFFTAAYLFGAIDELFQVHEALGKFLGERTLFGNSITDLVTLGYAFIALVIIIFCFRIFLREYRGKSALFSTTLFIGVVVYLFSTLLDTIDIIFEKKLRTLAKLLSQDPRYVFSDQWYVLWAPHNFFNGLEEVFEYVAATLFFTAALILFLEKRFLAFAQIQTWNRARTRRAVHTVSAFIIAIVIISIAFGIRSLSPLSPITDSRVAINRVAGPKDSLRHADDLFWHPSWGIIIGNEGRGTVLQVKDETVRILPDAEKRVHDTDSVTASEKGVYVSDGAEGIIFRYTEKEGWKKIWTREQGLYHPEALAAKDDILYVLDESKSSITRLEPKKKAITWKPRHELWKTPEGIAYDPSTDTLVATDDTTGAVFRIVFEKSIELIAQLKNPEDITVLDDGRILLTDNGWGAVFLIEKNKEPRSLVQFRRPYRDLQGIAVDGEKNIYVITADGFNSVSFMPSFLFRIEGVL